MDLGGHHSPRRTALEGNPKCCGRAGFSSEERRAESRAVEASDLPPLSFIPGRLGSSVDYFRRRILPPPSPPPKRTKPTRQSTACFTYVVPFFLKNFFLAVPRRILVSHPGIKPTPPAVEGQRLNHRTTREVPTLFL